MKHSIGFLALVGTALAASGFTVAPGKGASSQAQPASGQATAPQPDVNRGRYLVHHVAMCVQCHTPRDAHGQLIVQEYLHGESIPFSSPFKEMTWASRAPHIAGLPGYTRAEAVQLLTEGTTIRGRTPRLPMPPFRMSKADAEDVVAYLLSVE